MSKVSTYLNFPNKTEEAFNFYKSVFGTEFTSIGIMRFRDMPGNPELSSNPELENLVMHVELPIIDGHILMGSDGAEAMGFKLNFGNTMHINLQPDSRTETQRVYNALSQGATKTMPLCDMPWGAYFGSCVDKFGVSWMFNCPESGDKK